MRVGRELISFEGLCYTLRVGYEKRKDKGNQGDNMLKDILIVVLVIGGWYVLQRYILPKMGIST